MITKKLKTARNGKIIRGNSNQKLKNKRITLSMRDLQIFFCKSFLFYRNSAFYNSKYFIKNLKFENEKF